MPRENNAADFFVSDTWIHNDWVPGLFKFEDNIKKYPSIRRNACEVLTLDMLIPSR